MESTERDKKNQECKKKKKKKKRKKNEMNLDNKDNIHELGGVPGDSCAGCWLTTTAGGSITDGSGGTSGTLAEGNGGDSTRGDSMKSEAT